MLKKIVLYLLERNARAYLKKHKPLVIAVTGSVGKTVTKQAVATVLAEKFRVRTDPGNHNSWFGVPMVITGVDYPDDPHSFSKWRAVLAAQKARLNEQKDVEAIVVELGSDRPGDIARFRRYLTPDVAVVTAVSEMHMETFDTLEAVAQEVLGVAAFSKLTIIGRDDIDETYARFADTHTIDTYGLGEKAEYRLIVEPASPLDGRIGRLKTPEWGELTVTMQLIGDHSLKAAAASACVGAKLGMTSPQLTTGISKVKPTPGRMNPLRGQEGSTIIDDTYGANPLSTQQALLTLMNVEAPQRIAVVGSMNGLGVKSPQLHEQVGTVCHPDKLDWLVTIGEEAGTFLAPAAQKNGCQVKSFQTPYQAAAFVHKQLKPGAVVLIKGSRDGVYAEEAVKVLLHVTEDEALLVRQSPYWLARKDELFDKPVAED